MLSTNIFLDTLVQDFVHYAEKTEMCRAIILTGSAARTVRPADKYSDRDIQLFVTDPDGDQYLAWLRKYAPLWMVIRERQAKTNLWLIMYHGGHSLHLSINTVADLEKIVERQQLWTDQQRGYKILLDRDGYVAKLPPPRSPSYQPPSETAFVECVESFFYGVILIAKQLKRGHLWTVQWANCIEQKFLLQMLEWHAHAHADVDTWYRGEAMKHWVTDDIWTSLHEVFGHFDSADSWRALFAAIALFRRTADETATILNYVLPKATMAGIVSYVEQLQRDG